VKYITNILLNSLVLAALFSPLPSFAKEDTKLVNKELIVGRISANHKVASSQEEVTALAEKLLVADSNFTSLAVVGISPREFGIYFYYKKNPKRKSETELGTFLKAQGFPAWSYSDNVIIIK
jgi:hypothetical protein